jgi:NAD(P)H-dependent FMN reductase
MELAQDYKEQATFELVDLKEVNLPLLDEPQPPAMGNYQNDHTKKWAETVESTDAFVMVTPEYNHSYAPALKNAIDFVAKEWRGKPVTFVGYGADAGGARAIEHLRGVVAWLGMYDLAEHILIPNYWTQLDEQGAFTPTDDQIKGAKRMLENLIFWAGQMQRARSEQAS